MLNLKGGAFTFKHMLNLSINLISNAIFPIEVMELFPLAFIGK